MLDFKLFRLRNFFGANFMTLVMYGSLSGAMFLLVVYLQTALHYSALAAGISLLPITFCLLLFSARVESYVIKYGPRLFMTLGPIVSGVGLFMLTGLTAENANYFAAVFPGVLLFGIGMALTVAPLTSTVMSSVSVSHAGIASAVNNTASRVGGLLVIAILGVIAAAHTSIANAVVAANASYSISMAFCAVLAILAGIISFVTIRKHATV
jgi:MFS family permease